MRKLKLQLLQTRSSVSIILKDRISNDKEIFFIKTHTDLYTVNKLIDKLIFHSQLVNLRLSQVDLEFPVFDKFIQEHLEGQLELIFPNDEPTSIIFSLDWIVNHTEPDWNLKVLLEDSRHILNEAYKRMITHNNVLLRFVCEDFSYFYLKVSNILGNISITRSLDDKAKIIFEFKTKLKEPDITAWDFSKVINIVNIDQTRYEEFNLTEVTLLEPPTRVEGEEDIYSFKFEGRLLRSLDTSNPE